MSDPINGHGLLAFQKITLIAIRTFPLLLRIVVCRACWAGNMLAQSGDGMPKGGPQTNQRAAELEMRESYLPSVQEIAEACRKIRGR